ncbi:hypothetical protein V3W47_07395 [Deinococcus sp. YIM 134068]|uniref:hypothetical protein n=1 Tax=Deinococcus lichenicola TaxID=3118910 RepID=UPI002F928212
MKPIGPYVAARDLAGDPSGSGVRTLRATDRLTGMPVLLHVLGRAVAPPALPPSPALLPFTDSGVDGELVYLVTELPLHAQPAADPVLAAHGALTGLSALHEAGLTHGGVAPAQLWSVDGHVALAGAGLPWEGHRDGAGTPRDDLRALAATLRELGGVPPALRDAPESLTARELLTRLSLPAAPEQAGSSTVHDGTQVVLGEAPPVEARPTDRKAASRRDRGDRGAWRMPNVARASAGTSAREPEVGPAPVPPPEVAGPVSLPPSVPPAEAPRQKVIRIGVEAGPPTVEEKAREESAAPVPVVPPPTLIDMDLRADALADGGQVPSPERGETQVETPAGLEPEPDSLIAAAVRNRPAERAPSTGGVTPRRVVDKTIRIGWEEDHSWRVVRTGQAQATPRRDAPRWLWPAVALGALLLLTLLVWALLAARADRATLPTPQARVAGSCCEVRFTVRGSPGSPVLLSVVSAPASAALPAGEEVGTAPGAVRLPAPGTYTLRVVADGYDPGTVTITAPTAQPIVIDLEP